MTLNKPGPSTSKSKMTLKVAASPSVNKSLSKNADPADSLSSDGEHDDEDDNDEMLSSEDDEDEIVALRNAGSKSKKTAKRKRRATSPTSFGQVLQDLLGTAAADDDAQDKGPQQDDDEAEEETKDKSQASSKPKKRKSDNVQTFTILSLAPHLRRSAQSTVLSARAARIALDERKKREEQSRVKDVIGGWGPPGVLPSLQDDDHVASKPQDDTKLASWMKQDGIQGYERRLRKIAQRGVVKLFHAIRAAQTTTEDDLDDIETKISTSKGSQSSTHKPSSAKSSHAIAGKESRLADLSKNNFLDLIRKGSSAKSGITTK